MTQLLTAAQYRRRRCCSWCWRWCRSMRTLIGNLFLLTLFTRIVILAIAAVSLNLIMGYGGMVSFGHAAYHRHRRLCGRHPRPRGHQFRLRAVAAGDRRLGAVRARRSARCRLRTRGVYFIMITLAFAQMIYYVGVGLDRYGGDDGLTIYRRSQFGGLIDLSNKTVFYYVCLACCWRRSIWSGGSSTRASAW